MRQVWISRWPLARFFVIAVRNIGPYAMHQSSDSSLKEVAGLAGISVAATKSRLTRAKRMLRKAFELKESIIL
jgi:hypothetical protein